MVSLLDLKRRTVTVTTPDGDVTVNAVSIAGLTSLMALVPTVRKLMAGTVQPSELTVESLIGIAPDLVAGIIAAGFDKADDPEYIEAAANLPIGVQADLLLGVVEASMPKGLGPFMESVSGVMGALAGASGGKARATK